MFEGVCEPTVPGVQAADPFALAAALATVSPEQLYRCSPDDAECVLAGTQRVINAMSARQAGALERYTEWVSTERDTARAARGGGSLLGAPSPEQEAAASVAPILRLAPRTLVSRIDATRWLALLPRTAALAWAGALEPHRVAIITRAAAQVGIQKLAEFEARLHHVDISDLPGARLSTRAARIAARLGAERDPQPSTPPTQVGRSVRLCGDGEPGLTRWEAVLPADSSRLMWAAVEQLAAQYRHANPDLTVAQSRADALIDLVLSDVQVTTTATIVLPAATATQPEQQGAADPPAGTAPEAQHPGVPVVVPRVTPAPRCRCGGRLRSWADVLDLTRHRVDLDLTSGHHSHRSRPDQPPPLPDETDPLLEWRFGVYLQDHVDVASNPHLRQDQAGQIWFVPGVVTTPPVGTLLPRQLAAILADPDTAIRLATANPHTGAVDALDERTYRPGAALARLVRARDATCRFPGCNTPAARCDLDHVTPYPAGPTTAANLQTLCRVHHGFKHHARWSVTMTPDGIATWTAPNGRTHTTHPHAIHDDAA